MVTIVIPVWNSGKWLAGCLESLDAQTFGEFSVILVDNGSTDGSVAGAVKNFSFPVRIISFPENMGFAKAVNQGIREAREPYIALLNVDTRAEPDWLDRLVARIQRCPPEVGALASLMVRMDDPDLVDDAGDILSWYGTAIKRGHGEPADRYMRNEEVFSVCAGAALYRKEFLDAVGLFDERFGSYLEDVDLCLRGRLYGFRYLYEPTAVVRHEGHSAGVHGSFYVFLMTRNRLLALLKNIPGLLLVRHLHQILYGQLYFFLVYRRPLASLRGYLSVFFLLPHIVRARRNILGDSALWRQVDDSILSGEFGEPGLRSLIRRKCRCG